MVSILKQSILRPCSFSKVVWHEISYLLIYSDIQHEHILAFLFFRDYGWVNGAPGQGWGHI